MDPITIVGLAGLLAKVVPSIAGWIGGKDAEEKAEKIVNVASTITGIPDKEHAVQQVLSNPETAQKFTEAVLSWKIQDSQEDTKKLMIVNETMRQELSAGWWKGGWRPYWGYASGTSWFILVTGIMFILYTAVKESVTDAVTLATAIGTMVMQMTPLFAIALAVLGVNVYKRSQDKDVALTGEIPDTWMDKLSGMLKK